MSKDINVHWGWLKFMYIFTIVVAGGFGLGVIFMPNVITSMYRMPKQDPIIFGIVGSVYLAFGILSILGLRSPLKFVPILLLQLCYKVIWFVGVILPPTSSFCRTIPNAWNIVYRHIRHLCYRRPNCNTFFLCFCKTSRSVN